MTLRYSADPAFAGGRLLHQETLDSNYDSPQIYGLAESRPVNALYGPVNLSVFQRAVVQPGTDIVRVGDKAYWAKSRHPLFGNVVPADAGYISHTRETVTLKQDNATQYLKVASAFSLLGVHDFHWAHFLAQFMPRLRHLETVLASDPETVIIAPAGLDAHARELLRIILTPYGRQNFIGYLSKGQALACDRLYHADSQSFIADSQLGPGHLNTVIPNDICRYVQGVFDQIPRRPCGPTPKRIYMSRPNFRNATNRPVLESILRKHEFSGMEPHRLTLEMKNEMLKGAELLVAQFGSSLANVSMCRPGVEVIALSNSYRLSDGYFPAFATVSGVKLTFVSSADLQPNDPHSSYEVDPEVFEAALLEKIRTVENAGRNAGRNEGQG